MTKNVKCKNDFAVPLGFSDFHFLWLLCKMPDFEAVFSLMFDDSQTHTHTLIHPGHDSQRFSSWLLVLFLEFDSVFVCHVCLPWLLRVFWRMAVFCVRLLYCSPRVLDLAWLDFRVLDIFAVVCDYIPPGSIILISFCFLGYLLWLLRRLDVWTCASIDFYLYITRLLQWAC